MSNLYQKAFSGIKWSATASVAKVGFQFMQLAFLGRLLVPEDFGLMAMVMVIAGFMQAYTDMGISNAIIHRQNATREQLSSLYWVNMLVGILLFILVVLCTPWIVAFFGDERLSGPMRLIAVIFLITPLGQQFQTLLQKKLMFDRLAVIEISSTVAGATVAIVLAFRGQGVYALIWGQLANAITKALILGGVGMKRWRPHLHFCAKDLKGYMGFGMYQMGERTLNYLGRNMDKLLIGSLMGAQTLGYYQVAYQLMVKPFQVFNPIITRVSFPVLAKIQDDTRRLCRGYLDIIRVIALVLFPVYMGMIVLAKPFIILLLGQEWLGSVSVFRILAILGFFYSLGNPIGSLLLAKGRADIGFYLNLLVIFLYSIAILIGVRISIDGVAAALVIATALVLFPIGFWVRWFLVRMRPVEYIMAFMPMLASSLTMGVLLYFLNVTGHFSDKNLFHLLLFVVAGASVYLPIVLLWQKPILGRLWKTSRRFE